MTRQSEHANVAGPTPSLWEPHAGYGVNHL